LLLGVLDGRLVIRPAGVLGAFAVDAKTTEQTLAVLTHMKTAYGLVSPEEIQELEDLINDPSAKELQLQRFFEQHPQFLRIWDHREVFSQVHLVREGEGPLIPDFVLLNPDVQRAVVVDLKLPAARVITRKPNRERFSALVEEARAQLLEYRDWFDQDTNRMRFKKKYGKDVLRPMLGVVIGRQRDFGSELQRQKISSRYDDLQVVTYDDILRHAQARVGLIETAVR